MGNIEGKKSHNYTPRSLWKGRLAMLKDFLEMDGFAGKSDWHGSRWAEWERRIRDGHEAEEAGIERIYNKRKTQQTCDPSYDPAEWAGEDYMETCRLTSLMYAALVVGVWSRMEHFLKDLVILCYLARDKRGKALRKTQRLCEDLLARKKPKATLKSCIKALKELQLDIPYAFDEIKKALSRELNVQLGQCAEYAIVDAIRILSNSFKHSNGLYNPQPGKPHTRIDKSLLEKWSIDERMEIDYSKLPIMDLVAASSIFCHDLLGQVETALNKPIPRKAGRGK